MKEISLMSIKRSTNCIVHGSVDIISPIDLIIDTPQFQRLRNVGQVAFAERVYAGANHNRFTHSLGTYHLVFKFAKELHKIHRDKFNATDILCLAIAALIHDLGHGPFSHTFDNHFIKKVFKGKVKWTHEKGTIDMWHHLLQENPKVKNELDKYLTSTDYTFIEELIDPPKKLVQDKQWIPKGRPIEKSFLFCFVSNPIDGLDFDKLDYFVRDSCQSRVDTQFSVNSIERLLHGITIGLDRELGFLRIAWKEKYVLDLVAAFECRTCLYDKIYTHKTVISIETIAVQVLELANPYLKFEGKNGRSCTMSEAIHDMFAYEKMNDHVLTTIQNSSDPNLRPAREMLKKLQCRQIDTCIASLLYKTKEDANDAEAKIKSFLSRRSLKEGSEYYTRVCLMHHGLGMDRYPLQEILIEAKNAKFRRLPKSKAESYTTNGRAKVLIYLRMGVDLPGLKEAMEDFIAIDLEKSMETKSEETSDSGISTGSAKRGPDSQPEEAIVKRFRSNL